jgi:CBS domain-containing protein
MKNLLVADLMTRYPITAKPSITLLDAAKVLVKKRVGSLLLVTNKRLVGIISKQDILWALIKKTKEDLPNIKAIDISPKKIATIRPDATIEEALKKMKKLKFQKLPVINNQELVGLITTADILNFHPELYPELEELARIRESSQKLKRINIAKKRLVDYEGVCEECGAVDILTPLNGMMICEGCRNSM